MLRMRSWLAAKIKREAHMVYMPAPLRADMHESWFFVESTEYVRMTLISRALTVNEEKPLLETYLEVR